jgi:hypothetical protein
LNRLLIYTFALMQFACAHDPQAWWRESDNRKVEQLANEARQRDSNPTQYAYKEGTEHGCSAGKNSAGDTWHPFSKDVDKYVNDKYYKTGWDDGFNKCKTESLELNRAITDSLNRGW